MASGGENPPENSPRKVLLDPTEYVVIHKTEEGSLDTSQPSLECQFEMALEQGFTVVVVEPAGIGDNCIRWITVGNFLHKSAVLSALGTLIATPFLPLRMAFFVTFPLGAFGVGCTGLYALSWQGDPCCKYQVDYRGRALTRIPSHEIRTPSPVVLVRRNDKYRKMLQNSLSVAVLGYLGWLIYQHLHS